MIQAFTKRAIKIKFQSKYKFELKNFLIFSGVALRCWGSAENLPEEIKSNFCLD